MFCPSGTLENRTFDRERTGTYSQRSRKGRTQTRDPGWRAHISDAETLFVLPLDRSLVSRRELRSLSRAGPAPTAAKIGPCGHCIHEGNRHYGYVPVFVVRTCNDRDAGPTPRAALRRDAEEPAGQVRHERDPRHHRQPGHRQTDPVVSRLGPGRHRPVGDRQRDDRPARPGRALQRGAGRPPRHGPAQGLGAGRPPERHPPVDADQPPRQAGTGGAQPRDRVALGGAVLRPQPEALLPCAAGAHHGGNRRLGAPLRRDRRARQGSRFFRRADPRRPRLPGQPVPVAAPQPPRGRLRRQRRKPAPLRAGGLRRDPPPGGRRLPGIDQAQLGGLPERRLHRGRIPGGGGGAGRPRHRSD